MMGARWLIFTQAQRDAVLSLNREGEAQVRPRQIDNAQADAFTGLYAAPASLLMDAESARFHDALRDLPVIEVESDMLFLPPEE